jgi:3-oxoacyl-[acyl-carrier protein] reductase
MMKKRLALVTGGTSGIGKEIVRSLLKNNYKVIANYIVQEEADKLDQDLDVNNLDFYKADVTVFSQVKAMADFVRDKYRDLYLLVNNAGVMPSKTLKNMTEKEFDLALEVNLKGTFNVTKNFLSLIEENGRIVNMASIAGVYGQYGISNYAASKAGVIGFTKSIAKEFAKQGITVNAVAPGIVNTPLTRKMDRKALKKLRKAIPLNRFGTPQDIADAVLFLASDKANYITRHVLHIDGGLTF